MSSNEDISGNDASLDWAEVMESSSGPHSRSETQGLDAPGSSVNQGEDYSAEALNSENKLKMLIGGLLLASIAAVGSHLALRGNSDPEPIGSGVNNLQPISVAPEQTPSTDLNHLDKPGLDYRVESFVRDGFLDFATINNVSVLDGVSIVSGDDELIMRNPVVVVLDQNTPENVGVLYSFRGRPLSSSEKIVFMSLRDDGSTVDLVLPENISGVYESDRTEMFPTQLEQTGTALQYINSSNSARVNQSSMYFGIDRANELISRDLEVNGTTREITTETLLLKATGIR